MGRRKSVDTPRERLRIYCKRYDLYHGDKDLVFLVNYLLGAKIETVYEITEARARDVVARSEASRKLFHEQMGRTYWFPKNMKAHIGQRGESDERQRRTHRRKGKRKKAKTQKAKDDTGR